MEKEVVLIAVKIEKAALCLGLIRTTQDQGLELGWERQGAGVSVLMCQRCSTPWILGIFSGLVFELLVESALSKSKVPHSPIAVLQDWVNLGFSQKRQPH